VNQALHLADDQAFQCHSCGRCCRNTWAIRVEPQARQDIEASQAAQESRKAGFQPLVVLADGTTATGRRQDGACVFLTRQELCAVHGELGGARKPLACQLYPYSLTATPDGYFASLSFACPSVVAGLGGDLETNRRELAGLLSQRGAGPSEVSLHRVEVTAGRFVSWASYRKLEEALLAAFRPEDPVGALLGAAVGVVGALASSGGDPVWPVFEQVSREDPFEESLLAMFCASVIALWELPDRHDERQAFSERVLSGQTLASVRHGIPLPAFDFVQPKSPLEVETFGRYFRNAVFGKTLLAGPVVSRLLTLACASALVLYYSDAFRQAEGATELRLKDLARAFELVEADLVTHTQSADPLFVAFERTLCQTQEMER
jgi:Fe-S-cluster containining protein